MTNEEFLLTTIKASAVSLDNKARCILEKPVEETTEFDRGKVMGLMNALAAIDGSLSLYRSYAQGLLLPESEDDK